ncbi:hypothetical protein WMZ97_15065 [Lentibacillus sp. N15]|uniref:hypothetical protein n=1 Tax=Lentibacillus songyuanensis TaxID=3136161 RepID=UPI0031BB5B1F
MMNMAQKLSYPNNGIDKAMFNHLLQELSDQLRWVDQKLTMKVDHEITQTYHFQQTMIQKVQANIDQISK